MKTPSWPSRKQREKAYIHFVCAHFRTLEEAARHLVLAPKTLRKRMKELGIKWVPPLKRFALTLPPSPWMLDVHEVMLKAVRTGRSIELPDWLLLQWLEQRPHLRRKLLAADPSRAESTCVTLNNQAITRQTTRSLSA
jgi:hypothetical protein